jgi:hypothetical protein
MTIDLSEFRTVDKSAGIATYEKTVKTALPEEEDGSGYRTEVTTQTAYRHERAILLVRRVGNTGWSVWKYRETENGVQIDERLGNSLDEQKAKRLAKLEVTKG